MPTSTLIPGDEKQDEKNIGQQHADQTFNDLSTTEKRGTIDMDEFEKEFADDADSSKNINKIQDKEASGASNAPWVNNASPNYDKGNSFIKGVAKKKGPIAAILGMLGIGGFGVSMLFSPAILLVQVKETMLDKFNTQLASMETRSTRIMRSKFSSTTSGICSTKVSVACKYSTLSKKQVEKFKAAGIEVKGETNALGRMRPETFALEGRDPVNASEFSSTLQSDAKFRSAVKVAYNSKFAGFSDKVWQSVSSRLGINKTRALPDGDDAAKEKAIEEDTKSGKKPPDAGDPIPCSGEGSNRKCTNSDGLDVPPEEADATNAARAAANEALQEAEESAERVASKTMSGLGGDVIQGVGNFVKLTGYPDMACQAYTAVKTLGYAAKTIRAVQLARYAMVFLNTADQIKAGTATPEDVAYLGGILTNISYDVASGAKRKAAMDSFGMKYAMFGDVGKSDSYLNQFMAGGGLTGNLIAVTSFIENTIPTDVRGTCRTLSSAWVQFGSFAAGVGLMFVPGANIALSVSDIAKGGAQVVLSLALMVLPDLLKDVVAGTVTKGLVGEDAGNAITSGSGSMMSSLAQAGGNASMSVDDAVAYQQTQNDVIAQYAEEERATKSPLDATSKYTFLGSIVNSLTPYISSLSVPGNSILAISSLVSSSFKSIIPTSSAVTTEQTRAGFTSCNDSDYEELGIATDPFCNVVYGIPPQYLNSDPADVANRLAAAGQINAETGEITGDAFKKIRDKCIESTSPLGSGGENGLGDISDDKNCKITSENADYYVYWVDQRIESGFEGDNATTTTSSTTSSTAGRPDNAQDQGQGWTLKDGVDYSSVSCAAGTEDAGTYKHPTEGFTIRKCKIGNAYVNALASSTVVSMIAAAQTDGVTLTLGNSFRSYEEQQALYAKNCSSSGSCSPPTAKPGNSQHERGLAIDFGACDTHSTSCYQWLSKNAATYGYFNLPSEPWHWSVSGY